MRRWTYIHSSLNIYNSEDGRCRADQFYYNHPSDNRGTSRGVYGIASTAGRPSFQAQKRLLYKDATWIWGLALRWHTSIPLFLLLSWYISFFYSNSSCLFLSLTLYISLPSFCFSIVFSRIFFRILYVREREREGLRVCVHSLAHIIKLWSY